MEDQKIRVFIVDSSAVWRTILTKFISAEPDMEVAGEINSGQGSLMLLEEVNPDVVMLEASSRERMPVETTIKQLQAIKPDIKIIVCTEKAHARTLLDNTSGNVADVIFKPYQKQSVLRCIRESMERTTLI